MRFLKNSQPENQQNVHNQEWFSPFYPEALNVDSPDPTLDMQETHLSLALVE
jgi:hypothetical protein